MVLLYGSSLFLHKKIRRYTELSTEFYNTGYKIENRKY
jgi:hypothetical protein